MRNQWKKIVSILLTMAIVFTAGAFTQASAEAKAKVTCLSLCQTAVKATGNGNKPKNKSQSAMDFGALDASSRKKVKSIYYICDKKEVYSLCVMEAKSTANAKSLLARLNTYKKSNINNNYYLKDYTKTERNVLKNAVCGRKGKYVWYIAMSDKKTTNTKGQTAIKKKL